MLIDVWHRVCIRPVEEDFLIICVAILHVHVLFLYLVALPEKFIPYPLNLQMTRAKKWNMIIKLNVVFAVAFKQYREGG